MNVRVAAFTAQGVKLARHLSDVLSSEGNAVQVSASERLCADGAVEPMGSLAAWTKEAFASSDALVFVSACGIAVRAVAPYVQDKFADPAVVCVDELGQFAIALLSGHVGGANELARMVARAVGAQPVITTATDVNHIFAVDEWAVSQGLAMLDRQAAKLVSARLLEGHPVGFFSSVPAQGPLPAGLVHDKSCSVGISVSLDSACRPFDTTLRLVPRVVTVGVGCRRGTSAEALRAMLDTCLEQAHVAVQAVRALATIDLKADEQGLRELARQLDVPLVTYTADELAQVAGSFSSSAFVQQTVGVDNVCERAACAQGQTLVLGKQAADGVTMAVSVGDVCLQFDRFDGVDGLGLRAKAASDATTEEEGAL